MIPHVTLSQRLEDLLKDIFLNPPGWQRYYHSPDFSRDGAKVWIKQFGHFVRRFPRWMAQVMANCPEHDVRAKLIENLYDEEIEDRRAGASHYELFLRRGAPLGLSRAEVDHAPPLPSTVVALHTWDNLVRARSWSEGLAAMTVLEQTNDIKLAAKWGTPRQTDPAPWLRIGLTEYDAESNFVHEEADQEHSGSEEEMLVKYATTQELEEKVVQTAKESLIAWRILNDGIHEEVRRISRQLT